jgi:hypothetical protein
VPLSSLSAEERRVLCAHAHRNTFRRPAVQNEPFGFESPSGERWIGMTLPWYECGTSFPSCQSRLSEVLPCELLALAGDPGFFEPESEYCKTLSPCLWGFRVQSPDVTVEP